MITNQEKSRITKQVEEIKNIIEEYGCNPDDYDSLKTAVEIWNIVLEDAEIADNMRSYWANQNAGSA